MGAEDDRNARGSEAMNRDGRYSPRTTLAILVALCLLSWGALYVIARPFIS